MILASIPGLLIEVYCRCGPLFLSLLIEWIDRGISRPGSRGYLWGKSEYSHVLQLSQLPYYLCPLRPGTYPPICSRQPSLSKSFSRERTDHRESKSSFGETSLVYEPIAGEAPG